MFSYNKFGIGFTKVSYFSPLGSNGLAVQSRFGQFKAQGQNHKISFRYQFAIQLDIFFKKRLHYLIPVFYTRQWLGQILPRRPAYPKYGWKSCSGKFKIFLIIFLFIIYLSIFLLFSYNLIFITLISLYFLNKSVGHYDLFYR